MNLTTNDSEQPLMVATPPQAAVADFNQPDGFNLFDFDAFLSKSYIQEALSAYLRRQPKPGNYTITRLLGGLINVTARATIISNSGNELTIIFKYAPPFIAASPGAVPFSQFRQIIEFRALTLLTYTPTITQSLARIRACIPKVIYHDEREHVLGLEDLGKELASIDEWLCPMAGIGQDPESCAALGTRLGEALATVHTNEHLYNIAWTDFINPDASALVAGEVVGKIKGVLTQYLPLLGTHELISCGMEETVSRFSEIVRGEFESTEGAVKMFSNGDLWTGPILLHSGTEPKISIIDWEFAGAGKVLQDMAQLSAWLRLFAEATAWASNNFVAAPREHLEFTPSWVLARSCFQAYAERLRESSLFYWVVHPHSQEDARRRLEIIWSTWVLHGRELISNATSPDLTHKFMQQELEGWRLHLLELGCYYIQSAGTAILDDIFKSTIMMMQETFH